ncbi:uncharacterized protein LOC112090260 isoform X1 [Morus notabilis]|nr:uncharacterized protein LOC112090260 isoform X1 [Morus notabilis]
MTINIQANSCCTSSFGKLKSIRIKKCGSDDTRHSDPILHGGIHDDHGDKLCSGARRREIEDSEGEHSSKVVRISAVARKYVLVIRRKSSRKRSPDMTVDDSSSYHDHQQPGGAAAQLGGD